MSNAKWTPVGRPEFGGSGWSLVEERRPSGVARFRLSRENPTISFILHEEGLFDLADLLADKCAEIEDGESA